MNTLLYQVPGGMLSNLISQLKQANAENKYYDVLEEIPNVRKDFGYPPLVTPTSQIVGSQAVLNVLAGERYKMITKESKGLLRGEYGQLPGEVNEEVRKKAIGNDEVITCRPADLLEPEMEKLRAEGKEKGVKGLPMQLGIEMAAEMIAKIKDEHLCDGVHIMAIGAEKNVPAILEKAGVTI